MKLWIVFSRGSKSSTSNDRNRDAIPLHQPRMTNSWGISILRGTVILIILNSSFNSPVVGRSFALRCLILKEIPGEHRFQSLPLLPFQWSDRSSVSSLALLVSDWSAWHRRGWPSLRYRHDLEIGFELEGNVSAERTRDREVEVWCCRRIHGWTGVREMERNQDAMLSTALEDC